MPTDLQKSSAPLAEISNGPSAFDQFLDKNQKNLVALALLLALAGIALVIYRGIDKSNEETAGMALVKSRDAASLQKVIDEFPSTSAAASAMLLLGNQQWEENQQDAGISTLQKLIAEHPGHPAIPGAQASLASKLMTQGKTAEAIKLFETISNSSAARYIAPFALISLGDLAKSAGDLTKAEEYYSEVKTKFPDSPFTQISGSRMGNLKASAPSEIEPPPAPAPPPAADAPSALSAPVSGPGSEVVPGGVAPPVPQP